MSAGAQRVLRIARNVSDLPRAVEFYCEAQGFHRAENASDARPAWTRLPMFRDETVHCARLQLGTQEIELTEFDPPGAPYPADSTSADLWFQHCAIVVDDMDAAYERVMRHGASPITRDGPQTLPASSGGVTAFKFRDPDGHPLELIAFPPGSGDPAWQQSNTRPPTLGMDHSAISVSNADRSTAFYARLGFAQTARQINQGPEQQRLDALDNVQVEVVALQPGAARTPHVELLAYRQPRGRALLARDVRDIVADRIVLQIQNLPALLETLQSAGTNIIASDTTGDATHTALLCDPDGHLLELVGTRNA